MGLDKAGFTQTKIHMADASYMFLGIDRARAWQKVPRRGRPSITPPRTSTTFRSSSPTPISMTRA